MSENGLRKLFRINEIKIIMSVTGLHNKEILIKKEASFNFIILMF
jgi:hypothetical protein